MLSISHSHIHTMIWEKEKTWIESSRFWEFVCIHISRWSVQRVWKSIFIGGLFQIEREMRISHSINGLLSFVYRGVWKLKASVCFFLDPEAAQDILEIWALFRTPKKLNLGCTCCFFGGCEAILTCIKRKEICTHLVYSRKSEFLVVCLRLLLITITRMNLESFVDTSFVIQFDNAGCFHRCSSGRWNYSTQYNSAGGTMYLPITDGVC